MRRVRARTSTRTGLLVFLILGAGGAWWLGKDRVASPQQAGILPVSTSDTRDPPAEDSPSPRTEETARREADPESPVGSAASATTSTSGSIAGQLQFDEGVSGESFSITLQDRNRAVSSEPAENEDIEASGDEVDGPRRESPSADGAFRIDDLAAGTYDLTVIASIPWTVLALVECIEVRGGEVRRDPRLDPLDLRGRLVAFQPVVVDPRGFPVAGAHGVLQTGPPLELPESDSSGGITFFSAEPTLDLLVWAEGHRPCEIHAAGPFERFVLPDALVVRVQVEAPADLPYFFQHWHVELETDDRGEHFFGSEDARETLGLRGPFGPSAAREGEAADSSAGFRFLLPGPGRYRANFTRSLGDEEHGWSMNMPAGSVRVEDGAGEQSVELAFPVQSFEHMRQLWEQVPEILDLDPIGTTPVDH